MFLIRVFRKTHFIIETNRYLLNEMNLEDKFDC